MIDPETIDLTTTRSRDQKQLTLVMSDEFNEDGRSFKPNDDNLFTAIHQPGSTNEEIQFYDNSYVSTRDGSLILKTTAEKTTWQEYDSVLQQERNITRNYTSAMLQSWNQFCFTGGVLEMSIQLPGGSKEGVGGLWPAAWLMGNLARAAFPASTKAIWPWSYDTCDGSIPHLENRQEINACDPSPGHGMHPYQGRGSPEIDLFEVNSVPPPKLKKSSTTTTKSKNEATTNSSKSPAFMSASLQISPGVTQPHRPVNGHPLNSSHKWYDQIHLSELGEYNAGFWGQECAPINDNTINEDYKYWEDAVSANFGLGDAYFTTAHQYRLEWQPTGQGARGYLEWYLDGAFMMSVEADSLMNLTGSLIPVEPMYLVFNTAVSQSWGFPNPCDKEACNACYDCFDCSNPDCQCSLPDSLKNCANLPAEMKIDYIRLFQDPTDSTHTTSCSPQAYPTQQFISDHPERFREWVPPSPPVLLPEKPLPEPVSRPENITFNKMLVLFILLVFCFLFWGIITLIVKKLRGKTPSYLYHYHYRTPSQQHEKEQTKGQEWGGDIEDNDTHCGPEPFSVQINENTSLLVKSSSPCSNYGV